MHVVMMASAQEHEISVFCVPTIQPTLDLVGVGEPHWAVAAGEATAAVASGDLAEQHAGYHVLRATE